MTTTTLTTRDPAEHAARLVAEIRGGTVVRFDEAGELLPRDARTWSVWVPHERRTLRLAAVDGEWDAGVEIYILNRHGVCMASATVHSIGMTPRFVAEFAASLDREILR